MTLLIINATINISQESQESHKETEKQMHNIENLTASQVIEYLRKSQTDDPSLSVDEVLARHENILNDWAIANLGEKIPVENTYREVASGETIKDRPQMQEVLRKIESPHIKAILVVEPQRLSRGDLEDIGRLMKIIKYTNTLIITPTWIYDLNDKYDFDNLERELKRGNEYLEYTKTILNRGRMRSVMEGNYVGSVAPYGYQKTWIREGNREHPTLIPHPEEAIGVQTMFDLYVNKDLGCYKIACELDRLGIKPRNKEVWSSAAIKDMLSSPIYIGKVTWNWRKVVTVVEEGKIIKTRPKQNDYIVCDGKHEAIIDADLFERAQAKKGRNHRAKGTTKVRNPLAGLLYCQCGRAMTLRTYKHKDGTKRCESRIICDDQARCRTSSATYGEMIDRVKKILEASIADFEVKLQNNQNKDIELQNELVEHLQLKLQKLEDDEVNLWDERARNRGTGHEMPERVFARLSENIRKEQEEVRKALETAYEAIPEVIAYDDARMRFQDALDALNDDAVSAQRKNTLLKACIERMVYSRPRSVRTRGNDGTETKNAKGWSYKEFTLEVTLKI